ncbi:hypothetical protein Snas_2564 [Stackebrandtia nassauensis DSM 44728]|uniref:Large ribosomal subunit protein bL12 C-terminal domain-containing protein n=2 Tax=Stackebrandtia TaxID=283810 RepID=D3Q669_STANL|nr:hypothetical protein Snas_2564 [Stackebrandtia nassauensis DSM 44728]
MTMLTILVAITLLTSVLIMNTLSGLVTTNQRHHARVDRKLNQIMEHLGIDTAASELSEVTELALRGKKIQAIKRHRELTGSSLKEAKDAVERMLD